MTGNGLFGSTTLDVVIGLVFVYLLLAIICTTVNEWIATILKTRSTTLASAIKQLLDGQAGPATSPDAKADVNWFLDQFYAHPLIAGMNQPGKKDAHPAYLSPRAFAAAVTDITTQQKQGVISFADLETGINNLPNGDVKKALLALIQNANGDLPRAQKNIEAWFDDTMERASGWYKRKTQVWTVIIAVVLTLGANADTIRILKTLWKDPTLRAQLVEKAKNRTAATEPSVAVEYKDKNNPLTPTAIKPVSKDELDTLSQVLGWNDKDQSSWPNRLLGWVLTIVAVSLGAPFWFDTLNKFMRIRNAGDSPAEAAKTPEKPKASPADKAA